MFTKKTLRLRVCKTTHCSNVQFDVFSEKEDCTIGREFGRQKNIVDLAIDLRNYLKRNYADTDTVIVCSPKFDIIKNSGKNPTLYEALSPEEKMLFFKNLEIPTGGGAAM